MGLKKFGYYIRNGLPIPWVYYITNILFYQYHYKKIQAPIFLSLLEIINTHNFKVLQAVNNSSFIFTFSKIILLIINFHIG